MADNSKCGEHMIASEKELKELGFGAKITRRDFVGATALGAGAALLSMASPAALREAKAQQIIGAPLNNLTPAWTGPSGIGDYAGANGDTGDVVDRAHSAIRDQSYDKFLASATDTGESVDLVVVGCGISGLCAAYTYRKARPNATVLMLEQNPIFGGESRQNDFEVDGYHLSAPQGATSLIAPIGAAKRFDLPQPLYSELGFPDELPLQVPTGMSRSIRVPEDPWAPMHFAWWRSDTGFFYPNKEWVRNPWNNGFRDAPLPESSKLALMRMQMYRVPPMRKDWEQWLDGMTYQQFLESEVGITGDALRDVMDYIRPVGCAYGMGLGGDVISAYQACQFFQPGVSAYLSQELNDEIYFPSYPGGNALIARMFVKKLIPDAFSGEYKIADLLRDRLRWSSLDRATNPVKIRLGSTVMAVAHDYRAGSAKGVVVHYLKGRKLHKIHAKTAILAGPQHVNRHICRDIPPAYRNAMSEFHHAPMVNVNVAVRNWKFLDNLGIASARWFTGFGWWLSLRKQIVTKGVLSAPLDPAKPTVFTLYTPFPVPGLPLREQCVAARMRVFGLSFAQIELAVRQQFTEMFGAYGFDAKRDIAGIVANRFGHAYLAVPPYFYFGKDGAPAPKDIIRQRFERISFAHSELAGYQMWDTATRQGMRAAEQVLQVS